MPLYRIEIKVRNGNLETFKQADSAEEAREYAQAYLLYPGERIVAVEEAKDEGRASQ